MNTWSNLVSTDLGRNAKRLYDANDLDYHNWYHIVDCFDFLGKDIYPYDPNLDAAVLFHDCIYDNYPDKEERSKDRFLRYIQSFPEYEEELDVEAVSDIIMATSHHRTSQCKNDLEREMIRADLNSLADPEKCIRNFVRVSKESRRLYKITPQEFAKGSIDFMSRMENIVLENRDHDVEYQDFWENVLQGVKTSVYLAGTYMNYQE